MFRLSREMVRAPRKEARCILHTAAVTPPPAEQYRIGRGGRQDENGLKTNPAVGPRAGMGSASRSVGYRGGAEGKSLELERRPWRYRCLLLPNCWTNVPRTCDSGIQADQHVYKGARRAAQPLLLSTGESEVGVEGTGAVRRGEGRSYGARRPRRTG
jgi:hypothetical protein